MKNYYPGIIIIIVGIVLFVLPLYLLSQGRWDIGMFSLIGIPLGFIVIFLGLAMFPKKKDK